MVLKVFWGSLRRAGMGVMDQMEIRPLDPGEEAPASQLVVRVFNQFVAPQFPPEGREEFLSYATPEALVQRLEEGNLMLAAWHGARLAAFVEMREPGHIALFFTEGALQGQGLGKRLLRRTLELYRQQKGACGRVTVNASTNALEAYRRLGFEPTAELQTHNGISFVPMALAIDPQSGHT
jgi:GNAT superfamily N-acetyltransferase